MRYLLVAFIALFGFSSSQAQIFELGPYVGGSNFIGDVGTTEYIKPNSLAIGGIVKWNRSLRHSWRATLIHTSLRANDADSREPRRQERGYKMANGLTEVTVGMEYNFWEWNIYSSRQIITPYLSTGISGIFTNNMYVNSKDELEKKNGKFGIALPMIIGVKGKISRDLALAFEIGARITFHDNLDGSTPSEFGGKRDHPSFGNQNTNDWYMFTGFTLTYSFGRKPCYDTF